ncbi:universal stress protein [Sphingobium yanoikuyae]|uniref:universal stress protein n=1 Tax=Sphingobium yanoikuyae TaxID=13690 RepID=UPI00241FBBFD|nr:universal stress protein [Sphingobium yanoikuyae]
MADLPSPRCCKILLATDLGPRCDRALDRAVQLSDETGAELIAVYVADPADTPRHYLDRSRRSWRRLPDPTERMRWRLRRDLSSVAQKVRVIVEEGNPAEKLVDIISREDCDMIITGTASPESLGRMSLGSTVNRVLRGTKAPILVVHDRPRGPYRRIALATDFSDASVEALQTVAALFPGADLTLFHGYDVPFGGIADHDPADDLRSMEKEMTARFRSDERIDPALRQHATVVVEHGSPEAVLGDFVENEDIDLTVIGSHGRGAVFDALIGSTAKRLVETLESDLLVVHHVERD